MTPGAGGAPSQFITNGGLTTLDSWTATGWTASAGGAINTISGLSRRLVQDFGSLVGALTSGVTYDLEFSTDNALQAELLITIDTGDGTNFVYDDFPAIAGLNNIQFVAADNATTIKIFTANGEPAGLIITAVSLAPA